MHLYLESYLFLGETGEHGFLKKAWQKLCERDGLEYSLCGSDCLPIWVLHKKTPVVSKPENAPAETRAKSLLTPSPASVSFGRCAALSVRAAAARVSAMISAAVSHQRQLSAGRTDHRVSPVTAFALSLVYHKGTWLSIGQDV